MIISEAIDSKGALLARTSKGKASAKKTKGRKIPLTTVMNVVKLVQTRPVRPDGFFNKDK